MSQASAPVQLDGPVHLARPFVSDRYIHATIHECEQAYQFLDGEALDTSMPQVAQARGREPQYVRRDGEVQITDACENFSRQLLLISGTASWIMGT